jgi:ketosteroid isomerase-like protein
MDLIRRTLLTALVAAPSAALPALALAQGAGQDPAGQILALREKIRTAAAAKDKAALEALYHEDFMHLRASGRADLKAERIALLLAGESTIETEPEQSLTVQVYGPATAVGNGSSHIKDEATGRLTTFRWLVVYVNNGDGWRVALSQANRGEVPPKRAAPTTYRTVKEPPK